ncbi:uncharacterized protein UBRO_03469 [Ustilago bromivora]|uniref:LysM domain-containing protein n=1 Tax=Ustilago bromivora TaxID=307758 RepID=A0A1K0HEU4_9BASI|nr:uncharacterized protein UBRO_03469 [Ustilago bromivora]SYW84380.1 uncharacterized protein UBRO2_05480 [Ustilago bromivora]
MRMSSALLSAALLPLAVRAAFHSNDTACTRHYTVQADDTCDKIGQKTLTSTYQILAFNLLNAGADCYTLEIGSRLCLGRYGNDCQFVHQCTNQDTCESIANAYRITTERLQSNNPSLDCNTVYEGLMLCVSAGSIRPPADQSINATDVKVAREQARQNWLMQERIKMPDADNKEEGKDRHHHAHTTSKQQASHKKQHQQHHHAQKHSHRSGKGSKDGKKSQKPDAKQHIVQPGSQNPSTLVAQDSSLPAVHGQIEKPGHSHQDQAHARPAQDQAAPPQQRVQASQPSAAHTDELEHNFIDGILPAAVTGSNHTPPPAQQPQRRHRSLSSCSHSHRRSHIL